MRASGCRFCRPVVGLCFGMVFLLVAEVQGQFAVELMDDIDDPFGAGANKAGLLSAAEMKTDSGSEEILNQADQFVIQQRYDLASILWQRVIDGSGDQVFTKDEWIERTLQNEYRKYRSVTGDIESTLVKLPPEGLVAYRLKADGEAMALLNGASAANRESVLAEIVRRFFLSKLGDDAAFELACLKLDRGEFLPAARLLAKIATEYPDPSVRMGEIELRLAAVNARVGDVKLAREILGKIKSQPIPPVPVAVIRLVQEDIDQVASERVAGVDRIGSWTMPYGGPTRNGLMPSPGDSMPDGVISGWRQQYELTLPSGEEWEAIAKAQSEVKSDGESNDAAMAQMLNQDPFGTARPSAQEAKPATDDEIVEKWKQGSWLPVGQVLMNDGKLYFKTDDRVVCCDAATGELNWFGYRSDYPEDPTAMAMARFRGYGRTSNEVLPSGEREVLSFSDTLNQSMSIIGDKLMVVQGRALDFFEDGDLDEAGIDDDAPQIARFRGFGDMGETSQGRARENRLFAYHSVNGKLLWMLKASEMMPESKRKMAFAGSPVPYGSLMVVPAYEATSLWLFGLNPETGEVLWKSFLADEPSGQTAVNSPVRVAIDGGEAYVATGAGVIASVDAISGTLNWAVAYPRTSPSAVDLNSRNNFRAYGLQTVALDGWADDAIIPSGNAIVFAASDFNHLAALDRRTGSLLWESARAPIDGEPASEYVLGVAEGRVLVAGHGVVRAYKLDGGRLLWEKMLEEPSYARGMLTQSGIYLPLAKSILRISIEDGRVLETIVVESVDRKRPLGNLYTNGESIYSAGFRDVQSFRRRQAGEVLPEPELAPDDQEMNEVVASPHEILAMEAQKLIENAYGMLGTVSDAKSAELAGAAFDKASEGLAELATQMETLGAPDEEMRKGIEKQFAMARTKHAQAVSEALPQVIGIEPGGNELLVKMMSMHQSAEQLPMLKAFGIDLNLEQSGEGSDE